MWLTFIIRPCYNADIMAEIGMAQAREIINAKRAEMKPKKGPIELQSVRALLRRNGFDLKSIAPNYVVVDDEKLHIWIKKGGLRSPGRPPSKTTTLA